MLRHHFALQRRRGRLGELVPVPQVHRDRQGLHGLERDLGGAREPVGDHGRVHAALQQLEARRQEGAADDRDRGRAVARGGVLRARQLDEHLRRGLRHRHPVEDRGAVVGDDDLAVGLADLGEKVGEFWSWISFFF